MEPARSREEGLALGVGALLIAEGALVAAVRFFQLVYVVAGEAERSDRSRIPLPRLLPWLLATGVIVAILVGAGARFRRDPSGAWRGSRLVSRAMVVLAGLLNAVALARAVGALVRGPGTSEGLITAIIIAIASLSIIVGIVWDAAGRHRRAEDRTDS